MELEEFIKKLWFKYPSDLCHSKKGTKFNAEKAAKKIKASEYERILANVEALIRYDRKDIKPDRWPFISTFLNQGYYDRDIGSTADLKEKIKLQTCSVASCNYDVHGGMYSMCSMHLPSTFDGKLREAWKKTGLDRGSKSLANDCREYCKNKGYLI